MLNWNDAQIDIFGKYTNMLDVHIWQMDRRYLKNEANC